MDDAYIIANCHKSGEKIARELGEDAGNVRKRIRKLRVLRPDLEWYGDPRQVACPEQRKTKPKPVKPRKGVKVDTELTVVCGDMHVPFHDPQAIGCVLGYIRDHKPNRLVLNGDVWDASPCSTFSKSPERELTIQDEIDQTNEVLDAFDAVMPKGAHKVFVVGNHEARLPRYLRDNARVLHSVRTLTLESVLKLDERGYEVVPMVGREASTHVGKVEVGHFNCTSQTEGAAARKLLIDRGCSVIQSHTHKLAAVYKRHRGTGQQLGAWEIGCLCSLNPEYIQSPSWQTGFATITTSNGRYHVALHEILGGELLAGGRRY